MPAVFAVALFHCLAGPHAVQFADAVQRSCLEGALFGYWACGAQFACFLDETVLACRGEEQVCLASTGCVVLPLGHRLMPSPLHMAHSSTSSVGSWPAIQPLPLHPVHSMGRSRQIVERSTIFPWSQLHGWQAL